MTLPKLQQWLYVKLTTKTISDNTTNTYYLSNRAIIDDSNVGRYVPILSSVGSFGANMGDYLPSPISSSIDIVNTPNSFGYERRFSDLFDRETCIGQTIELYAAETELNDLNVSSDFVLAWSGTVLSYQCDGERLTLKVSTVGISQRVLGKEILSDTYGGYPGAPAPGILGQVLPLVFGDTNNEVRALYTSGSVYSPSYSYAATMGTQYPMGGVNNLLVKNSAGDYTYATTAFSVSTSVAGLSGTPNNKGENLNSTNEIITRLDRVAPIPYVITKLACTLYYNNTIASTTDFTFTIYESMWATGLDYKELAKYNVTATTGVGAAAHYTSYVDLAAPIFFDAAKYYFLGITTGAASDWWWSTDTTTSAPINFNYTRPRAAGSKLSWTVGTVYKHLLEAYSICLTDSPSGAGTLNNTTGYGHAYFTLTQNASNANYADLTKLEYAVVTSGLKDDTSGNITGSASSVIKSPQHLAKLLDLEWNGSTWTGGKFDFSEYSATYTPLNTSTHEFYRTVIGNTEGAVSLESFYEELCKNSACRISYLRNNKLGFYAWGTNITSSATITDEDTLGDISVTFAGVETVVNRVSFAYKKTLRYSNITDRIATQNRQYTYTLNWNKNISSYVAFLVGNSEDLYGARVLKDSKYDFVPNTGSAECLAKFILNTYKNPSVFVEFEVPFFKYSTIDLLDVVTLVHPGLPAYFGTSQNASLPTYTGIPVDLLMGDYLKRAKPYRAQIEGREVTFDSNSIAKIRFTARLLLNPNDPT